MTTRSSSSNLEKHRATVVLRDGSTLQLRPMRPDDEERLLSFFYRLSPQSVYFRFHRILNQLSREEARRFCNLDYHNVFALAAVTGDEEGERIVGTGRYYRLGAIEAAELTLVVEDAYQGKGIGTQLLEHLASVARENGIVRFEAEVLAENQAVLRMLKDSGFEVAHELESGIYRVVMPIAPTPTVEERSAEREKVAAIASLGCFLKPRSIAVIGASRRDGTIGNRLFRNILLQGFSGVVYPVNPNATSVASVKAYPSVLDIPGEVEMAVIIVPATMVNEVVQQCGRKGVRGLVVISAGFGESGPEGMERQRKLLDLVRSYGMRLIGPNCMGVINTDPEISMNATFSLVFPASGSIAFCSQSGALGLAILEYAQTLNVGLSSYVSIGNRADVSSNDLLQYWEEDPATRVILLYLESFGNPKKFGRIARRVAARKPIVAVKSGRTTAGSRAAASHTGALASGDAASEALFRQVGIIRVDTLEELFDVANLLTHQPLPPGRRVAILTNGGGPGIMTADACAARGLEMPALSDSTLSGLGSFLPSRASLANPIDLTAEATAEDYSHALKLLAEDENVDIAIVIFVPPIVIKPEAVASAIRQAAPDFRQRGKTLLASFMSSRGAPSQLGSSDDGYVPCFTFPESTAAALSRACDYSDWLKGPKGTIPRLVGIDVGRGKGIVRSALERSGGERVWLDAASVNSLLEAYGIRTVSPRFAATAEEAVKLASEMGYPVAVKLASDTITHKTEVGGVVLDLRSDEEVLRATIQISQRLASMGKADEMKGVLVQRMVEEGVEVIVGVTQDPSLGPLIMFGTGGVQAELFRDVTFSIHPITDVDARQMVRSVKAYRLLEGWRGSEPCDVPAVEDLLLRISAMVEDLPQIAEVDLNPVKVLGEDKGCLVVDARVSCCAESG
ncbi:MAG: GNAT family N-acetyltransferase [Chloroflexi bacterium]|nr:MAG: GNAT family N-acetyltransferase [Chloroflexota bacterium]